jgi:cell wall-associated NlpC family hydrolase
MGGMGGGGGAGSSVHTPGTPGAPKPQDMGSQLKQAADITYTQQPSAPLDIPTPPPTAPATPGSTSTTIPEPNPVTGGSNPTAESAIKAAMTAIGKPYVWGGNSLAAGVDCSGLIQQAYKQAGIDLPRVSNQQIQAGTPVDPRDMQPGDILGWAYNNSLGGGATHVAMYIGGGKMIEALHTGVPVHIVNVRAPQFVTRPTAGSVTNTVPTVGSAPQPTIQPQNTPQDSMEARLAAIDNAFSSALSMNPMQGEM